MVYKVWLITLLSIVSASACGVDSDFSESESKALFSTTNSELHTLHVGVLEEFGLEQWPTNYSYDCPGGGVIAMVTTTTDDNEIKDLLHTMIDCVIDGRTLNGNWDYLIFENRDCNGNQGLAFDIDGEVSVSGGAEDGTCALDARESCSDFTGKSCGYDV